MFEYERLAPFATPESAEGEEIEQRRNTILEKLPKLTQLRFTFVSVTVLEDAARTSYLVDVKSEFEEKYGVSPQDFGRWFSSKYVNKTGSDFAFPGSDTMSEPDAMVMYTQLQSMSDWASVMSCLRKVEQRENHMMANDDDLGPIACTLGSPYLLTIATGEGMLYSWKDYEAYLAEAGFHQVLEYATNA